MRNNTYETRHLYRAIGTINI